MGELDGVVATVDQAAIHARGTGCCSMWKRETGAQSIQRARRSAVGSRVPVPPVLRAFAPPPLDSGSFSFPPDSFSCWSSLGSWVSAMRPHVNGMLGDLPRAIGSACYTRSKRQLGMRCDSHWDARSFNVGPGSPGASARGPSRSIHFVSLLVSAIVRLTFFLMVLLVRRSGAVSSYDSRRRASDCMSSNHRWRSALCSCSLLCRLSLVSWVCLFLLPAAPPVAGSWPYASPVTLMRHRKSPGAGPSRRWPSSSRPCCGSIA